MGLLASCLARYAAMFASYRVWVSPGEGLDTGAGQTINTRIVLEHDQNTRPYSEHCADVRCCLTRQNKLKKDGCIIISSFFNAAQPASQVVIAAQRLPARQGRKESVHVCIAHIGQRSRRPPRRLVFVDQGCPACQNTDFLAQQGLGLG